MKLNLVIPALVFIILVLAFGWLRSCESAKKVAAVVDNTQFRTIIAGLQADTTELRAKLRQKATETRLDSIERSKSISGRGEKIVRQKAAIVVLQPQVQARLDSVPLLKELDALKDSTITELTNVNEELRLSYVAQVKGLNEQIELHAQIQAKSDEIMRVYEERIAELMKQNRKEIRRKKFWRTTTVIMTAGLAGVVLAQ
jgi:hypothetical protein